MADIIPDLKNDDPKTNPKVEAAAPFKDRAPCNWTLTAEDDGTINGVNQVSGETFSGSMQEFNARLKG